MTERARPSDPEQTLAAAVGLQTAAIEALTATNTALTAELRLQRQTRIQDAWRAAIAAVIGVVMYGGMELLR